MGFFIAMPQAEQGFQPKLECVQHTLAIYHRIHGGRALPASPLLVFDICHYVHVGGGGSWHCYYHTLQLLFGGTKQHSK